MKPSWEFTFQFTWAVLWRFCVAYLAVALPLGAVIGVIIIAVGGTLEDARLVGRILGFFFYLPALLFSTRNALGVHFRFQEEPNQPPEPTR